MPRPCSLAVAAALLVGCATAPRPASTERAHNQPCGELPVNAASILREDAIVVVTTALDSPALGDTIAALACHADVRGLAAEVALELPSRAQPRIDRYLASMGATSDRIDLLREPWIDLTDRSASRVVLDLIEGLRRLRPRTTVGVLALGVDDPELAATRLRARAGTRHGGFTVVLSDPRGGDRPPPLVEALRGWSALVVLDRRDAASTLPRIARDATTPGYDGALELRAAPLTPPPRSAGASPRPRARARTAAW